MKKLENGFIQGIIIIFTRDKKLKDSEYYTKSVWLTGELSFAIAKGKPFLVFYDELIHPDERKGIEGGDYNYITFNRNCLDNSFLEAIPYLGDFRQKILTEISS